MPYICGRMDHQLQVLKRGPQNLQRKPSEYLRSIYMDIVSPLPEAMRFAMDFSGAERLLFSSDHPWVQPAEILEPFRTLQLTRADEAKSCQKTLGSYSNYLSKRSEFHHNVGKF